MFCTATAGPLDTTLLQCACPVSLGAWARTHHGLEDRARARDTVDMEKCLLHVLRDHPQHMPPHVPFHLLHHIGEVIAGGADVASLEWWEREVSPVGSLGVGIHGAPPIDQL